MQLTKQKNYLHTLLFAITPPLFLYAKNFGQLTVESAVFGVLCLLSITLLVWLLMAFFTKSSSKAAVAVSIALIFIFSYNSFSIAVYNFIHSGFLHHIKRRYILLFWALGLFLIELFIILHRGDLRLINSFLSISSRVLIALLLGQMGINYFIHVEKSVVFNVAKPFKTDIEKVLPLSTSTGNFPDIYHIVFDAYASEDVLLNTYGFDNSPFIASLEKRGFLVKPTVSNYAYTLLSMPSILNMEYIDSLESITYKAPNEAQKGYSNKVSLFLKEKGYKYVTIGCETCFADSCISSHSIDTKQMMFQGLIEMTALQYWIIYNGIALPSGQNQRAVINGDLSALNSICQYQSPKFVSAYFMSPHHPFVFDKNGNNVSIASALTKGRKQLYVEQIQYLNKRIESIVDTILTKSTFPPIIIIQSDHGHELAMPYSRSESFFLKSRFRILNAIYCPDQDYSFIPKNATPVNSFRLIFNRYLNADFPVLYDSSYMTMAQKRPYRTVNVTDVVNNF